MSILALTPTVLQTLRADLHSGQWSPTTQQFFQQLFVRVGGATAPTILELAQTNEMALGGETSSQLAWLFSELDAVKAQVLAAWDTALQTALSELAPSTDRGSEDGLMELASRTDLAIDDLDLSPVVVSGALADDLSPHLEAVSSDFDLSTVTWP